MTARSDALVVCDGEWDIARAEEFAGLVTAALARGTPELILDFRTATFVDASTVGAICAFAREASAQGIGIAVACSEGVVRRIFDLVHLSDVVPIVEVPTDRA